MHFDTRQITRKRPINIIVAVDCAGGFGKGGNIPWHFSEDLKRFKKITDKAACIMGRKTYDDMLEMVKKRNKDKEITELLPNRQCIVVTSDVNKELEGATRASSLNDAIKQAHGNREIFVVGGEKMYVEALSAARRVEMTIVKGESYDCDRFFPVEYLHEKFKITEGEQTDDLYFVTYNRR